MNTQSSSNKTEIKGEVFALLEEANKIYKKIYKSALIFLVLGLVVAAGGVLYFYFSNDALFLDRAFYEERIATLESDKFNIQRGVQFFVNDHDQRVKMDTTRRRILNQYADINLEILASYKTFYEEILISKKEGVPQRQIAYINSLLPTNDSLTKKHLADSHSLNQKILLINNQRAKLDTIIADFEEALIHPALPQVRDNDKPELTFTPKLVYGFLSRLGGLIFIELVAFYLLRQYRVNMNDFRYYYGIARQARVNLYLLDSVEKIEDEKTRIDIVSKLFSPNSDKVDVADDSPLAASDIDAARKLLDSIKDLIKK